MIKYLTVLVFSFFLNLPFSIGCSCITTNKDTAREVLIKSALKYTEVVFLGKLISKEQVQFIDSLEYKDWLTFLKGRDSTRDINNYKYFYSSAFYKNIFLVKKIYKGEIKLDTFIIYSGFGHGDCGYVFDINNEYIIYGKKEDLYHDARTGDIYRKALENEFWTDICTRTTVKDNIEIAVLEKLTK